jgi:hypothetical protein
MESGGETRSKTQKPPGLHRTINQLEEKFAARIFHQQHCAPLLVRKRKRARCTAVVQVISEAECMGQLVQELRTWPLRRHEGEDGPLCLATNTPATTEGIPGVLVQRL